MKSKLIKFVAAIVIVVMLVSMFSSNHDSVQLQKPSSNSNVEVPSTTLTMTLSDVPEYANVSGYFATQTVVHLAPRVSARINNISVEVGSVVVLGDVLFSLDARDAETALRQAVAGLAATQTAVELSTKEFARTSSLVKKEAATQQQLDQVTAQHQANLAQQQIAQRQVEQAQTQLGYFQVTSPIAGVIQQRLANAGDLAAPGQAVLIIGSSDNLEFIGELRESLRSKLSVGDAIEVVTAGTKHFATIKSISPKANQRSHSFTVKALLDNDGDVHPGMHGSFEITADESKALLVPVTAVRTIGQLQSLRVQVGDTWIWRNIRARRFDDSQFEVIAGLAVGDVIGLTNE